MASRAKSKAPSRNCRKGKKTSPGRASSTVAPLPATNQFKSKKSPGRMLARREPSLPAIRAHDSVSRALAAFHADALGATAYLHLSNKMPLGPELLQAGARAVVDFQAQMQPRDALERLSFAQVALAHARTAYLTPLLSSQTDPDKLRAISEGVEKAANTFSRLTRLIRDYRQPRNSSTTVIGQANLARQQIVQTDLKRGMLRIEGGGQAALPPNAARAALPAGNHPTDAAVEEKHGTKKRGRKAPGRDERAEARRAVGRRHRFSPDGKGDD